MINLQNPQRDTTLSEISYREMIASIIDPQAWADLMEARKGNRNAQYFHRIDASLVKADLIIALSDTAKA